MEALDSNHIRLFHISPGSNNDPVRCHRSTTCLDDSPEFEALSYTWGASGKTRLILCDDRPLGVTENLYEAIRSLRHPQNERTMWIDAICIQQDNDEERTAQVRIMKDIYSSASNVIIWLGTAEAKDDIVYSLLKKFEALFEKWGWQDFGVVENTHYEYGFPEAASPDWTALVRFFQRPWFQRVWVIQEAVMASKSTLAFGKYTMNWRIVCRVAMAVRKSGAIGTFETIIHCPGVGSAVLVYLLRRQRKLNQKGDWSLLDVLRLTRRCLATDLRDKVFALVGLGISPKYISSTVKAVDYAMTAEEVYHSVAIHALKTDGLELLSNAGLTSTPSKFFLPTWVPDLSNQDDFRTIINTGFKPPLFNACAILSDPASTPDPPLAFSLSPNNRILTLRGRIIDTISSVAPFCLGPEELNITSDPNDPAYNRTVRISLKIRMTAIVALANTATKYSTSITTSSSSLKSAIWRTLCCNVSTKSPVTLAPETYSRAYEYLLILIENITPDGEQGEIDWKKAYMAKGEDSNEALKVIRDDGLGWFNASLRYALGRIFGITESGWMGNFPIRAETGDKVVVLDGGRVPFVLRRVENGLNDGKWILVGECYVQGIMDGEAVREAESSGDPIDEFEII